jgi:hypothetical protein
MRCVVAPERPRTRSRPSVSAVSPSFRSSKSAFMENGLIRRRSSPHRRFRTPLLLRLDRPLGVHAVFLPGWWATIPRTLEHSMSWTAHYFDRRLNSEGVSRACASKEDALLLACDLIHRKCIVRFITGPNDEKIDATEITSW